MSNNNMKRMIFLRLFTRDKQFYKTLFHLMIFIVLQNIVTYSINMADNLMLGSYSQDSLAGAAAVNMIQFVFQSIIVPLGDCIVVIGSQYWGQGKHEPVRHLVKIAMATALAIGIILFAISCICPAQIIRIFTPDDAIIQQGVAYLSLIKYTYPLFAISSVLMASLRTIGTVNISFGVSVVSLIVDVCINYTLIFGHFGAPEMGIRGAAVGTLVARILELCIVLYYLLVRDKKLNLLSKDSNLLPPSALVRDYFKTGKNLVASSLLWAMATPIQTGILGHLNQNAIAANSVSTTLFQYLKVITQGEASAAGVVMGRAVGEGDLVKIKEYTRTLQTLFFGVGVVLGIALFFIRIPLLTLYDLTPNARVMANQILILMAVIMVGMAYQMPCGSGIIRGGGDTKFMVQMNFISTWLIVIPLSFMSAFWWKLPVVAVVAFLNSDQIFKCVPVFIRTNSYKWIRRLTSKE